MIAYLSMAANRAVDEYAIKTCGIPGSQLMLRAGQAVVEQMRLRGYLEDNPEIVVLAGHGNNGGDGFVIAAELFQTGHPVSIITSADPGGLKGDALHYFQQLDDLEIDISIWNDTSHQHEQILQADIIVDALLGTGIEGYLRPPYDSLIGLMNQSKAVCVAVDLPSGVTGDLGEVLEPCIHADVTVSMGYGKQGCLFEPARSLSGKVVPVDIGFPEDSLSHVQDQILYQSERSDYPESRYTRRNDTHKYTAGKVFIIAGSKGFTGAALLASTAALRSGAGLVRLAIPESLGSIAECISLETVVDYLPETASGGISLKAMSDLQVGSKWADTVVIGPGLGRDPETIQLINDFVLEAKTPLVIDADALFAISKNPDLLAKRNAPTIITPHRGEFKRLMDLEEGYHQPTWRDAQRFAMEKGVYLLLKGAPSLLVEPSSKIIVNNTGYAGMATAGSGDVLSGVIGALWAQWPDDVDVLHFAMYIHGKAAELNQSSKSVLGLIASDIVTALPLALKEYGGIPD